MRKLAAVVLVACLAASGCASRKQAAFDRALTNDQPPDDFWLAVTVLKAPAEAASRAAQYRRLPVAVRPARYVVEADRVLRVAVGSGADEDTFPPQTRQLDADQFIALWDTLRASPLVERDNAARIGVGPSAESIGARTMYVVSYSAAGQRRTLAMDAAGEYAEPAKKLVEQLAGLAWME